LPAAGDDVGDIRDNEEGVPAASAAGTPSWSPILAGAARTRALESVDALAARLEEASREDGHDASLSAGSAGLAVFGAELDRAGAGGSASGRANPYLDHAFGIVASEALGASLYAGFTGVAWAAEVIGRMVSDGEDDVNEEIDGAILQVLARVDWQHAPYDVIYGLTGIGVYAVERWPRPAAQEVLTRVVGELARCAREDEHGSYWWTAPSLLLGPNRERYPEGGVDLGVAHGVAGVIPLLARARALGVAGAEASALAERSVEWLLAQAVESATGPTIPYFVAAGEEPRPARLAWCYGDAGVAAALIAAGRDAEEPAWVEAGTDLALGAATRPADATGVTDAGFCHGSAGLAHLFNRMYQTTRDGRLLHAAHFWLEQTFEGLAADEQPPYNGLGLLEGAAGVALVLLAATSELEPHWDRIFLVAPLQRTADSPWFEAKSAVPD
jgi:lantibiotic modifying enzyme